MQQLSRLLCQIWPDYEWIMLYAIRKDWTKQGDWMWSDNADIFLKKERVDGEWGDNADISKQRDWMWSGVTRGQYRQFVWGHQRRRRLYERRCRRFGDLSQICQYCQFVNIVSRPRWLNNLKYCWLNIKLPWTYWGQRENKQNRDPKRLNSKRMHRKPKSKIYMKA